VSEVYKREEELDHKHGRDSSDWACEFFWLVAEHFWILGEAHRGQQLETGMESLCTKNIEN
jgi:hypothetical protein